MLDSGCTHCGAWRTLMQRQGPLQWLLQAARQPGVLW